MSGSYNILKDTWIYQDIKREVQEEIQQRYVEDQRRTLLEIARVRFPRIEGLIRQFVEDKNELELLQTLIIQVSTARLEKDARQGISKVAANALKRDTAKIE